uniref:Uncharacterized protein n=1 Tax=Trichogramma kaykai TaxID=54128 RepID=A0ABD2WHS4_9HYME
MTLVALLVLYLSQRRARGGGGGSRFVRCVRRSAKCYFFLNRREIVVAMTKKGPCFFFYFRSLLSIVALDPIATAEDYRRKGFGRLIDFSAKNSASKKKRATLYAPEIVCPYMTHH